VLNEVHDQFGLAKEEFGLKLSWAREIRRIQSQVLRGLTHKLHVLNQTNQSVNQSINKSINQSINQSISQLTNQ